MPVWFDLPNESGTVRGLPDPPQLRLAWEDGPSHKGQPQEDAQSDVPPGNPVMEASRAGAGSKEILTSAAQKAARLGQPGGFESGPNRGLHRGL